jgi:hypothetical protein
LVWFGLVWIGLDCVDLTWLIGLTAAQTSIA